MDYRSGVTRAAGALALVTVASIGVVAGGAWGFAAPPSPDATRFRGLVIAHRGGSEGAPENTLGAIRRAKEQGATAVEIDVFLAKDGVPMVIHDPTLDRTTNGAGPVSSLTVAELQALDASMGMPGFEGERIPTLDEVAKLVRELDLKLEIELKTEEPDHDGVTRAVAALFPILDLYDRAWVASFDPRLVYAMRALDPRIVTGFAFRPNATGNPVVDRLLVSDWLPRFLGAGVLEPHAHTVSVERIVDWHAKGYALNVWTLNGCTDKTWFRSFDASYTTNCPGRDCADDPSDQMDWPAPRHRDRGPCPAR